MREPLECSTKKAFTGRRGLESLQTIQPFPSNGLLVGNLNRPLRLLASRLRKLQDKAYSYVVRTVTCDREGALFEQHGSAPNFQGGALTLCTCKHQMRSTRTADQWRNVWIAGFTSRTIHDGKHWLFFLAKIDWACESHSELWSKMDPAARTSKAAHRNYLGDVFKPKNLKLTGSRRYSPTQYVVPRLHVHRQYPGANQVCEPTRMNSAYVHFAAGASCTPLLKPNYHNTPSQFVGLSAGGFTVWFAGGVRQTARPEASRFRASSRMAVMSPPNFAAISSRVQ